MKCRNFNYFLLVIFLFFSKLMPKTSKPITAESCLLLNISSCPLTETESNFVVTIYNPLSRPVDRLVKLPIPSHTLSYEVLCPMGKHFIIYLYIFKNLSKIPIMGDTFRKEANSTSSTSTR